MLGTGVTVVRETSLPPAFTVLQKNKEQQQQKIYYGKCCERLRTHCYATGDLGHDRKRKVVREAVHTNFLEEVMFRMRTSGPMGVYHEKEHRVIPLIKVGRAACVNSWKQERHSTDGM
jgi:hypothetical protein